ncbi:hypothetical protein HBI56_209740 [Parastagonospora nodorum]|uniref:Uncharacterized protein n=1 Tax=Phaeosphaeria nodorum (strain SN15 / ATCC MYA-4574 / FGSC 10173) TaxID=321614 RepID=A0A7U2F9S0_PHANO|nr:hypothetical protein HBH56_219060 [Parastagonospora nodorum]QRD01152.1 hypothetical protein JI435_438940 [Parastagonospora nodorum SN15]KAH3922068.1 hypothetical protein HBH54_229180 [Parastagonospora nodorum]KAH3941337.1 hypothetical protein HBH53_203070 [Parastagonospora nodorum]KAH3958660.1 hypothetical protein HBH51_206330 [Parastagonospora nodorum]
MGRTYAQSRQCDDSSKQALFVNPVIRDALQDALRVMLKFKIAAGLHSDPKLYHKLRLERGDTEIWVVSSRKCRFTWRCTLVEIAVRLTSLLPSYHHHED